MAAARSDQADPASQPPPHRGRVANATYGLIIAAAIISGADPGNGDQAAKVAVLVAVTLGVFYLAHVYAVLLGNWSEEKIVPTWPVIKQKLKTELPMLTVVTLPVFILLLGVFDAVNDVTAVNAALILCVASLLLTSWFAAREAGASRPQSAIAVAFAVGIGAVIILLKVALP